MRDDTEFLLCLHTPARSIRSKSYYLPPQSLPAPQSVSLFTRLWLMLTVASAINPAWLQWHEELADKLAVPLLKLRISNIHPNVSR